MGESSFSDKTDQELVLEFKQGNESVFQELIRRYKEKAMQITFVTTGNFEDAKDASQEAFVKAHRALRNFEMRSQFSTWLYRILMNTARDYVRRRKWQRFLSWKKQEEMENFFESVQAPGDGPRKTAEDSELGIKITSVIKRLPFQQQWIFTLRYLKGFSLQQIAEVAEISEGTVKATLHIAVQKFRKEIFPYLQEEAGVS